MAHADYAEITGLLKVIDFRIPSGSSQFCQYKLFLSGLRLECSILNLLPLAGLVLVYTVLLLMDLFFFNDKYCLLLDLILVNVVIFDILDYIDMGL